MEDCEDLLTMFSVRVRYWLFLGFMSQRSVYTTHTHTHTHTYTHTCTHTHPRTHTTVQRIEGITTNVRLGFGSFSDKVTRPFTR